MKKGSEEIRPGLWRLFEPMGARLLSFYALQQNDGWLLFDAGLPSSISGRIDDGSWQGPIKQIVVSHADADHLGDVALLKEKFPNVEVYCHPDDKDWVEDHDLLTAERYDHAREQFGYSYSSELLEALRGACGDSFKTSSCIKDGDTIDAAGQKWEVLHTPGHSPGHLCLWCSATGELLLGDAVLGRGPAGENGEPSLPPTHQFIDQYLNTIKRLEALPVTQALPCHWAPMSSNEFKTFLQETREVVFRDLALIQHHLTQNGQATFEELLNLLNDRWSTWDSSDDPHYFYALSGYIEYLGANGFLKVEDRKIIKL